MLRSLAAAACCLLAAPAGAIAASAPSPSPSASTGAGAWPQFQGSAAHLGTTPSATIAPPLQELWRFAEPDGNDGLSAAVVTGGVAVAVGEHGVYGVDAATGEQRWRVDRNGGRISSPAVGVVGGRQIVVYTEGATGDDASVVAIDASNQDELWREQLETPSDSGITVDGSTVLLGDRRGRLYSFDLASGRPATWSPRGLGARIDAPPAADGRQIFAVTRNTDTNEVTVFALDEATGTEDWSYKPRFAAGTGTTVTVEDDKVYFGMGAELRVHALTPLAGGKVWEARARDSFSPLSAPAASEGRLFIVSTNTSDSVLYAYDASDGSKLWDFQFQEATIRGAPVVAGDAVFLGTDDGTVAAVDARSGIEVWEAPTGPGRIGPLALSGDELIASKRSRHGGLIAFGPDPTGKLVHIESPTKLKLGAVMSRYAISFVAVFVVVFGAVTLMRRRVGLAPEKEAPEEDAPGAMDEPAPEGD
ncbi:MAG: PQQ-binding-like beta-propeller repeat protein [Actinomycetota bacterium]